MLKTISIENSEEWDSLVKTFLDYDVYYLSSYCKAFQLNGDGDPILIYIETKQSRAINVVLKRDIQNDERFLNFEEKNIFDIITPYGYGGFLVEGPDIEQIESEYIQYCNKENIVSEFVRFHPVIENSTKMDGFYDVISIGKTISIDTTSSEVIWKNITSKNRNMIRKAKKNGLKVFWGRDENLVDIFIPMYEETMKKDHATDYYYFPKKFYASILEDLKYNSLWFYSKKEDQIISMAIFLFANGKMHYHLSASNAEYRSLAPSNLMIFEAAQWAASQKIKTLHLGGGVGGSEDDPLFKFKKAFNKSGINTFSIGKKIYNQKMYADLLKLRNMTKGQSNFFPEYRG